MFEYIYKETYTKIYTIWIRYGHLYISDTEHSFVILIQTKKLKE